MIIDAVYDLLCPWCLVAKRQLDLAIRQTGAEHVDIRWHQFMLYPGFDRKGHDFLEFFRSKYGDALRVPMWEQIRAVAAPIGIDFAFEKITRGPASLDSHRLVRWAERQRPGSAGALYEHIASGLFERACIIDDDFLVAAAAEHGLDGAAARAHLASDADLDAPFAETEAWRQRGVSTMPHYILTFADGHSETVTRTSTELFADALRRDRAVAAAGA